MNETFKTSGSISVREINEFIGKYSRATVPLNTAEIVEAKSVDDSFGTMQAENFELPNGNFNRPHNLSEVYGMIAPQTAWVLPRIACWARIDWDGSDYRAAPLRSREYNIPTNNTTNYTDQYLIYKFCRASSSSIGNSAGGRFVTYRATSYAKDPGVAHPLPPEIKNKSRYYGLWAANSWWDWSTLGEIRTYFSQTIIINGISSTFGTCIDNNGIGDTGPGVFTRYPNSPSNRTVYEFLKGDAYDYNEGTYYFSGRAQSWGNCNSAFFPGAPTSETKTLQDALMYWDTNDIPYTYWPGLVQPSKLQGNLEQFFRYEWNSRNPYNVAAKNIGVNGVLVAQSTDFHLKITGAVTNANHITLESGSYTNNNAIFDEYKTIYYQTGLVYIRDDQTTSSNFGLTFNHDKCANGYMKIEVGASPEYLLLPYSGTGGSWIVIHADDIVPNGVGYLIKSSVSYLRTFSNKTDALSHWKSLHYDEHYYQMNTNIESYKDSSGNYITYSWGDRVPGRSSYFHNSASKKDSDWCFYLTQRTKGTLNDFGFTENGTYKTYGQFYEYVNNDAFSNSSGFGWNTKSYGFTDDPSTCLRARWKGSKYKFDLLHDAYKEAGMYSGSRLADESYMPRMHTGLKIEVKYIIELRMAHQIQIERAVRYCEKLSTTNSFQSLYVWPFDDDFALAYGATIPSYNPIDGSGAFVVIGHATVNTTIKYLHINIKSLTESTDLYSDTVAAIRSAFGI